MAGTIVLSALIGVIAYYSAFIVNDVTRAEASIDKKALLHTQYLKFKEERHRSLYSSSSEDVVV